MTVWAEININSWQKTSNKHLNERCLWVSSHIQRKQRFPLAMCHWAEQMWKPHGGGWEKLVRIFEAPFPGMSRNEKKLKILFVFHVSSSGTEGEEFPSGGNVLPLGVVRVWSDELEYDRYKSGGDVRKCCSTFSKSPGFCTDQSVKITMTSSNSRDVGHNVIHRASPLTATQGNVAHCLLINLFPTCSLFLCVW